MYSNGEIFCIDAIDLSIDIEEEKFSALKITHPTVIAINVINHLSKTEIKWLILFCDTSIFNFLQKW